MADVNAKNIDGWAALHFATSEGYIPVVKELLEKGADLESRTRQLKTPLLIACCRGDLELVQLFSLKKADMSAQDIDGNTCLHILAMYGVNKVMKWVIENCTIGLIKNIKNSLGKKPCEVAVNKEVYNLLQDKILKKEEIKPRVIDESRQKNIQVYVHKTSQDTVNKYMGKMLNQPSGDLSDDDLDLGSASNSRIGMIGIPHEVSKPSLPKKMPGHPTIREKSPTTTTTERVTDTSHSSSADSDFPAEEKVGPQSFIIHQVLGKGSFGEVYLVEKLNSHRYYAMKVLSKRQIVSQNIVKYAVTERNVLSITQHPFIVKMMYAFQTKRKLFLILEYCPGGDLSEYIEREKKYNHSLFEKKI